MENTDIKTREGFVVMRCDVEMGYTNDEPICIMLENTYESRLKAANECGLYGEAAEKFAREKCWETKDRLTTYSIYKTDVVLLDDIMNSPEIKAMIDKCNELGDEIKQLKEKCKKLEAQKKKTKITNELLSKLSSYIVRNLMYGDENSVITYFLR